MAEISAAAGIAIEWVSVLISTVFVALRMYVRWWKLYHVSCSDMLVLIAWFLFIYVTASNTANWGLGAWDNPNIRFNGIFIVDPERGIPPEETLKIVFKLFYIAGPIYYVALWCIKFAFIIMYYQLIPKAGFRWLRLTLHLTLGITIFSFLLTNGMNLFICQPISRNWELDPAKSCLAFGDYRSYFATLSLHLITDILIFAIPFPLLRNLQLSPRAKYGVFAMFALGAACVLCTVGRSITVGKTFALPPVGVWAGVEMAIAICVICAPTLKWLLEAHGKPTASSGSGSRTGAIHVASQVDPHSNKEWGTVTRKKKLRRMSRTFVTEDAQGIWKATSVEVASEHGDSTKEVYSYRQRQDPDDDNVWTVHIAHHGAEGDLEMPEMTKYPAQRTRSLDSR